MRASTLLAELWRGICWRLAFELVLSGSRMRLSLMFRGGRVRSLAVAAG